MEGLDAAKKKKDRARRHKKNHTGYIHVYTIPKLQYSQLNNLILQTLIIFQPLKIQLLILSDAAHYSADQDISY